MGTIYVKKERYALLLTADAVTHDIPCAHFARSEDYESYKTLLKTVKEELHYPIKGIVIDGDLVWRRPSERYSLTFLASYA